MPANRIQPRTWFVEFSLTLLNSRSDDDIKTLIINIMDKSNEGCRRIRGLQHVAFAHTSLETTMSLDPMRPDVESSQANVLDVIGFVHCNESILDTTIHSWIQDSSVNKQHWTPVPIKLGAGCSWMQQDLIKNFFDDCQSGRRVRVDWLWTGDISGSIKKRGRPKRQCPGGDTREPPPSGDLAEVRLYLNSLAPS